MDKEILEGFKPAVKAIAEFLGPTVEIVLHDLIDDSSRIIVIENGEITGRKVGDSLTEAGRFVIKKLKDGSDYFGPYESVSYKGEKLRSITIGIRNKNHKLIGLLCFNMNLSTFESLSNNLKYLFSFESFGNETLKKSFSDENKKTTEEIFDEIYAVVSSKLLKEKISNLAIIKELYERDFFRLKDAISVVSKKLNISIYTVYAYLRKVKKEVYR